MPADDKRSLSALNEARYLALRRGWEREAARAFLAERLEQLPADSRPKSGSTPYTELGELERRLHRAYLLWMPWESEDDLARAVASNPLLPPALQAASLAAPDDKSREWAEAQCRLAFAAVWPEVWATWASAPAEGARDAIQWARDGGDDLATDAAEERLAAAVREWLPAAHERFRAPNRYDFPPHLELRDEMFAWRADAVEWIASLPFDGAAERAEKWADTWRKELAGIGGWANLAEIPWDAWDGAPQRIVARALWLLKVKPELERERRRHAGITMYAADRLLPVMRPGVKAQYQFLFNTHGEPIADLKRQERLQVPSVEMDALRELVPKGAQLLGTLNAHRLFRWEVLTAHRRYIAQIQDARVLRVEGGWDALAEAVGAKSKATATELHAIVAAQAHLCFIWPDGARGNLLSYTTRPARRGQRSEVTLILGDMLLPEFVRHFGDQRHLTAREGKRLVPIVDLPPMVGTTQTHGAQAALQLQLLAEFRKRAVEMAEYGGVLFTDEDLARLARESGLGLDALPKVIDAWMKDGDNAPAFLQRTDKRITLAPSHSAAREFLVTAGRMERTGRENGIEAVARKVGKHARPRRSRGRGRK